MSNVSLNNITNSDCFYGSYLPEDGFNVNSVNSSGGQFAYQASGASSEVHSDFVSPAQPIAQFPTQTATEDCFDKSSDSAVSSMSSDRVPSYSDNVSLEKFQVLGFNQSLFPGLGRNILRVIIIQWWDQLEWIFKWKQKQ